VSHKSGSISPQRKSGWRCVCCLQQTEEHLEISKQFWTHPYLGGAETLISPIEQPLWQQSSVPLWCFAFHMASVNLSTACWPQTRHHLHSREQSRLCLTSQVQSVHHAKVVGDVFVVFHSRKNISQVFITVLDTSIPRWR